VSIVKSVRRDQRLAEIMIGAPGLRRHGETTSNPNAASTTTVRTMWSPCARSPTRRYLSERRPEGNSD